MFVQPKLKKKKIPIAEQISINIALKPENYSSCYGEGGRGKSWRERGQVKRAKFIADETVVCKLSRTKSISHGHVIIIAPCNQSLDE